MEKVYKIASILAFVIGILSIFAGSKVLLGIDTKNYAVLNWLVTYNVIVGFISILTAYLIWSTHMFAKKAIIFVLASHILLLLYLNFFNENVASESINAIVFRVSIWSIIALITINLKPQSK